MDPFTHVRVAELTDRILGSLAVMRGAFTREGRVRLVRHGFKDVSPTPRHETRSATELTWE